MLASIITLAILWLIAFVLKLKGQRWAVPIALLLSGIILTRMTGWPGSVTAATGDFVLGIGPWLSKRVS